MRRTRKRGWSDLPPDLLREIAGRLHVAADLVSFHAVCKLWRSSRDLLSMTATTHQLLPWYLAPTEIDDGRSSPLKLRCVFSRSSYRVLPPPYPRWTNWVCSADGATLQYLTVDLLCPTLHDPITGAVTDDLPPLPYMGHYWEAKSGGIVYGDGTIFLYGISRVGGNGARFRAALLHSGDAEWMMVDRRFESYGGQGEFCAAYHRGRILVTVESSLWHVVVMPDKGDDVLLVPMAWTPDEHWERCNYVLESRGELLWASVEVHGYAYWLLEDNMSVSVHALEETETTEKKMRWVRKDGRYLADRLLFLGSPNSFAVDVGDQGGGCAYFVFHGGVFRYNFVDGKSERVERLPQEWDNHKCTWLVPHPTIAPIQEIIGMRKLEQKQHKTAPVTYPSRIFHIERHYEHSFRVLVHDLPLKLKKPELQLFFSNHGKVSSIRIIYNKCTRTSQGIVKIATMHAHQYDALAALQRLVLDRCRLEVILVDHRRHRQRCKAA